MTPVTIRPAGISVFSPRLITHYDTDHALSPHSRLVKHSASRDAGLADTGAGIPLRVSSGGPIRLGWKGPAATPTPDIWTAFKRSASHRLYMKRL